MLSNSETKHGNVFLTPVMESLITQLSSWFKNGLECIFTVLSLLFSLISCSRCYQNFWKQSWAGWIKGFWKKIIDLLSLLFCQCVFLLENPVEKWHFFLFSPHFIWPENDSIAQLGVSKEWPFDIQCFFLLLIYIMYFHYIRPKCLCLLSNIIL